MSLRCPRDRLGAFDYHLGMVQRSDPVDDAESLLAAAAALRAELHVPELVLEGKAGLPRGFLAQARLGKYRSLASHPLWDRLRSAIETALGEPLPSTAPNPTPNPTIPSPNPTTKPPTTSTTSGEIDELRALVERADSVDAIVDCQRRLADAIARGAIELARGRLLGEQLVRVERALKLQLAQASLAKAGEPVMVRVVYVDRYRTDVTPTPSS